jgi:Putative zinc-finger
MKCKHVQELLPLYVGRDLEEKRAKLIMAHMQSCAECASSADEYRETLQLLQRFAPRPFSEAVYAEIRQRVLHEIGRESTAPTLPQLVGSLFRPRLSWAVATGLLLAVGLFAFYYIANRRNDPQQVANSRRTLDRTTMDEQPNERLQNPDSAVSPSPSIKESDGPTQASTGRNTGVDPRIAGSVGPTYQSQRRKSTGAAAKRTRSVAANTPDTRSITAGASPGNNLFEPKAVPARDPSGSEKTLRVEMQTKDPNVRIIWFSHQLTKQESPKESSKGVRS